MVDIAAAAAAMSAPSLTRRFDIPGTSGANMAGG
jgi:hypothetical protein